MLALNHLNLTITGKQLFDELKNIQLNEKVEAVVSKLSGETEDNG